MYGTSALPNPARFGLGYAKVVRGANQQSLVLVKSALGIKTPSR